MKIYEKDFICKRCGAPFQKAAKKAYYCEDCRKKVRSEQVMRSRKKRFPETAIGVGSGGNQRGRNNHNFKDGLSHYKDNYNRLHPEDNCCAICGSTRCLVVHHVDMNRKNNHPDNLVKICRSCHAQVHRLAVNFGETPMVDREE